MTHTRALILAGLGIVACIWFWLSMARPLLKRARAYIAQVSTCGYLPAPPSPGAVAFLRGLARFFAWWQAGKLTVIGRENLKISGPFVLAPNHPHYVDPAIAVLILDRPARFMAARGVFRALWGLGSLICSRVGAFAADLTPGKGGPAREAGIKVLTSGQTLVMFPEGWAYLDGKLGQLKKGAVRIAREAQNRRGSPVHIVPVFLRYGRYPGSWIKKLNPTLEYLFLFLNAWYYRRGVTAVVGKPISSAELPLDDARATELLAQRIVALDPAKS